MAVRIEADAGPSAFEIQLGINLGRNSPEAYETIMVNAETTVNWIFVQAAYVLSHVHGRDRNVLESDFDLYLLRPGGHDIALSPSRVIADYNIIRHDKLQLRHKTLPIPICINFCEGEDRKVEVNSGFPLMDVVPEICKDLGIRNYKELSLSLPSSGPGGKTMQYEWLDLLSSLHGQGVQQGDTIYLRKKFFILNDDISEALEGNSLLVDLIYQQIRVMFTTENYVGSGKDDMPACTKITSLLHQIEQMEENISDEAAVLNVMPRQFQKNSGYYEQTVMSYYSENVGSLNEGEAKKVLLNFFLSSQSVLVNYFPVTKSDSSGDLCDLVLTVDSNMIKVCKRVESQEQVEVVQSMSWRLRDLRDAKCTTQKDQELRINILGNWHEFVTDHTTQIIRYLMEAQHLTKLRVAKGRLSSLQDPALRGGPDIATEVLSKNQLSPQRSLSSFHPLPPHPIPESPSSTTENLHPIPEDLHSIPEDPIPITDEDPVLDHAIRDPLAGGVEEAGLGEREESAERAEPAEREGSAGREESLEVDVIVAGSGGEEDLEAKKLETAEDDAQEVGLSLSSISATSSLTNQNSPSLVPTFKAPPPPPLTSTPQESPATIQDAPKLEASPAKLSASPAKSSVKSSFLHIPEFLGMDFREVLSDYRLFHIVVMKQDVRTLLLNIKKPIQDVINSLCGIFDIPGAGSCYLWIPTGIQAIIEKYGGKPNKRAGKFLKKHQNGKDFAPRLDTSKTLEDQYDFSIKPLLLHLRRYQTEETDGMDETDCGTEWPEYENPDVARYRSFYQSWTGIVQGAYPIERKGAVKLAALLTQIYYGDREEAKVWPPRDYDAKIFLPEKHKNAFGIISDVEKLHRELSGKTTQDSINDVVTGCRQLATMRGVFFEVAVPVRSEIFSMIPWNKMEQRWFGVNRNGVFSINRNTGEINFTHKLSDLSKWTYTENSFKLTFRNGVFDAYTFQTKEIVNTLEMFTQMVARNSRRGTQEPEEPEKKSLPPSPPHNSTQSTVPIPFNGSLTDSPHKKPVEYGMETKTPLNLEIEMLQSVMISPTSYDL